MEKYKLSNGNTLIVFREMEPENPRTWDNLGKMVCFNRKYSLGDNNNYDSNDYDNFSELEKAIRKDNEGSVIILPLFLYDHGGITVRTIPFNDSFDSGQVGFIYATKKDILKLLGCKILSKKAKWWAMSNLENEVKIFDQYLNNETYRFDIENMNGDIIESRGGFYTGSDPKENGMTYYLPDGVKIIN